MSAKTSTPGRRTPLSLTGSLTKGQSNKGGGNNAASNSGNNANGHSTANSNKQDNKLQQQKTEQQKTNNTDTKENPNNNKKSHQQSEKKQQQHQQQQQSDNNKKSVEKNQNGINNNSKQHQQQQANENKQAQQQPKDSKQQNGNENKLNENDKKEKPEKEQDKTEKVEIKAKEDKKSELEKQENNKKEEKKTKEIKDSKDTKKMDKNETANRVVDESAQNELHEKSDDKNLKDENDGQVAKPKPEEEKTDSMEVVEEQQQQQPQQKSQPSTPKLNKANKSSTSLNKTPTEKTPQKMTFSNVTIKASQITKREVTTTIDDVDMEPLTVEGSPIKTTQTEEVANLNIAPSATSTPGKILLSKRHSAAPKSEVQLAMQSSSYSPERPRGLSQISGRKSIRPITDYTPSKFHSNSQFRESYRRINTELDVTNTSINVTVGSEVPSNLSFSFFGRGRKRERTPPQLSQSAIGELHTDVEVSPPKKARLEGFFSAVSSPLTLLRNRFSKATLQSSTPVNLQQKLNAAEDEIEVQNVSGLSIHEDLSKTEKEAEMSVASNNEVDGDTGEAKSNSAIKEVLEDKECNDVSLKSELSCGVEQSCEASDIKITETLLKPAVGDPLNKNKRCIVM